MNPVTVIEALGGVIGLAQKLGDLFDSTESRAEFEARVKALLCGVETFDEMVADVKERIKGE